MKSFIFCIACFAVSAATAAAGPFTPQDLPDLIEKVSPSAVHISTKFDQRQAFKVNGWGDFFQYFGIPEDQQTGSLGSGFIMDSDGFILTNYHVVEQAIDNKAVEIVVTLKDKRQFEARIVGRDSKTDIALLQLRDPAGKVPPGIKPGVMGSSDKLRIGEPVIAIGNPFGLDYSVSAGIISSKNRNIGQGPFDNYLQTDAAINPGNSGGPLFNTKGEIIGINSMIFSRTGQFGGIGFAIPIDDAKAVITNLKKFGRVPRPWIGIISRQVTPTLAYSYGLGRESGIIIINLVQSAPADRSELQVGDIIYEIGGKKIIEQQEVERALAKLKPTDNVEITVQRGRKTIKKLLKLEEFPPQLNRVREGVI
ncbi:MAG: trypsin-like peptidase domain-containing protein [Bdellovibrionales bacterium]|nr:trypsin-like peptidase domain-containing protein [Bdellovibrionales bacterium]